MTELYKCSMCKKFLDKDKFHKDRSRINGVQGNCKTCANKYHREYFKKNIEKAESRKTYYKKYRISYKKIAAAKEREYRKDPEKYKKIKCREILNNKIITKKINKRNICEICYCYKTECHHSDYNNPLSFIELCKKCHNYLHKFS